MNTDAPMDREDVRALLRAAFRGVHHPGGDFKWDVSSHKGLVSLRQFLTHLSPEEIHYVIPAMLEDMLDNRRDSFDMTEDEDLLAGHLAVSLYEERVRAALENQYQLFDKTQAKAIVEWLRLALTWSDYSLDSETVNEALNYWEQRARMTR